MNNTKLLLLIGAVLPGLVFAGSDTGKGSNPKGKPFVEIQGQFVEVNTAIDDMQAHIDELAGDVDDLESRVTANETAIAGLEAQNVILIGQIEQLLLETAANDVDIANALALIEDLERDLLLLREDASLNALAIAANEAEILVQRNLVTANTTGLQSLIHRVEQNYQAIGALNTELDTLRTDLDTKQDILNGVCAPGTALTAIDPSGAITCQTAGGTSGLAQFTVTRFAEVPALTVRYRRVCFSLPFIGTICFNVIDGVTPGEAKVTATCPVATVQSGGGFDNPYGLQIVSSQSEFTESPAALSWAVRARNHTNVPRTIYAKAECLRFD